MSYYTTQDSKKTLEQQIRCVQKEFNSRKRVYPQWVEGGRMTKESAQHEIDCMEAVYYTLSRLNELREASEEMKRLGEKQSK